MYFYTSSAGYKYIVGFVLDICIWIYIQIKGFIFVYVFYTSKVVDYDIYVST